MKRMLLVAGLLVGLLATFAAPASAAGGPADIQAVLDLTNQQRAAAGLGALRLQAQLQQSAQSYADQLANGIPFSHTGPDGSTPFTRMQSAGYRGGTMGENIARGFATPQDVMTAWMNSPGHRANILYAGYTQIGIGAAGSGGNGSWVQDFGAGGQDLPLQQFTPPPAPIVTPPTPIPAPTRVVPPPLPIVTTRYGIPAWLYYLLSFDLRRYFYPY